MPQAKQVIAQCRCGVALRPVFAHRCRAVPLGQLRAIGPHQHRHVAVHGHWQGQCPKHQYLPRRVGEMVVAAQYMGDAHRRIIDCIAEEKRGGAVGAAHDEIADVVGQKILRSTHEVEELHPLAQRHLEAQGRV